MGGLSSADFRSQAQARTLVRNGNGSHAIDPVDDALAVNRKLVAQRMLEQSVAQRDTEAIKAENERLKALAEQEELRRQQNPAANSDPWRDFMMNQLQVTQQALNDTQNRLSEQQSTLLQERVAMLQGELEHMRGERPEAVDPLTTARASIESARAIMDLVTPATPPPSPTGEDGTLQAWILRARLDHEERMAEREERREDRRTDFDLKLQVEKERLALERERNQRMDRFLTDTAPRLLSVGENILARLMGTPGAAAPPVAAAQFVPDGFEAAQCQTCGADIHYQPNWPGVGCPKCGSYYSLADEHPSSDGHPVSAPMQAAFAEHVRVSAVASEEEERGLG